MVVRDHEGDVLISTMEQGRDTWDVLQDEAFALLFGLRLTFKAGFRRVVAEVDCLELVGLILGNSHISTSSLVIVKDIQVVARYVIAWFFDFRRRCCNKVALAMDNLF